MRKNNAYIIGAGMTGLSVAYRLAKSGKYNVTVFEGGDQVGGMAYTFRYKDFLLDLGPHKIFSTMEDRVKQLIKIVGEESWIKVKKKSMIRLFDKFLDYPVGPADIFKVNPLTGLKMGIGYLVALVKNSLVRQSEDSYEDFLKTRFGAVTYNLVFAPYAKKIWADPARLDKELAATRVVIPSLTEMIKQMVFKQKGKGSPTLSAEEFDYPKYGSGVILENLAGQIKKADGKIRTDIPLEGVEIAGERVVSFVVGGLTVGLSGKDILISTIPLRDLINTNKTIHKELSGSVNGLTNNNLVLVYLVLKQNSVSDQNWYFFPEERYIFNRVSEQKSFSEYMIPQGETVLCCEITCSKDDPTWEVAQDKQTVKKTIGQLHECGLVKEETVILESFTRRIKNAYPIYSLGFRETLNEVFKHLDSFENFYSIGRQGGFNYVGMVDCFDIGMKTTDYILGKSKFKNRKELRDSFFNYVVID